MTKVDFSDGTGIGFVAGYERDRLESADCPAVAVISWTESEK